VSDALRHDTCVSLNKVALALVAQGELAGALTHYREALELRRALAAKDPGNAAWTRDLAWNLGEIGGVLEAQGDLAGALGAYHECLGIRQALSATEPDNAGLRDDIAFTREKIAHLHAAQTGR
jgi:tetratricopeptide (TPR) repeat protein